MANGNGGSLASAWRDFDDATKLNLTVTELDRIYARIERHARISSEEHAQIRREFLESIAAVKADFHERIETVRKEQQAFREEVRDGFAEIEKRDSRKTALFYTMIGGIVVGLFLLVAQLAAGH